MPTPLSAAPRWEKVSGLSTTLSVAGFTWANGWCSTTQRGRAAPAHARPIFGSDNALHSGA
jgi:hypothetical protein